MSHPLLGLSNHALVLLMELLPMRDVLRALTEQQVAGVLDNVPPRAAVPLREALQREVVAADLRTAMESPVRDFVALDGAIMAFKRRGGHYMLPELAMDAMQLQDTWTRCAAAQTALREALEAGVGVEQALQDAEAEGVEGAVLEEARQRLRRGRMAAEARRKLGAAWQTQDRARAEAAVEEAAAAGIPSTDFSLKRVRDWLARPPSSSSSASKLAAFIAGGGATAPAPAPAPAARRQSKLATFMAKTPAAGAKPAAAPAPAPAPAPAAANKLTAFVAATPAKPTAKPEPEPGPEPTPQPNTPTEPFRLLDLSNNALLTVLSFVTLSEFLFAVPRARFAPLLRGMGAFSVQDVTQACLQRTVDSVLEATRLHSLCFERVALTGELLERLWRGCGQLRTLKLAALREPVYLSAALPPHASLETLTVQASALDVDALVRAAPALRRLALVRQEVTNANVESLGAALQGGRLETLELVHLADVASFALATLHPCKDTLRRLLLPGCRRLDVLLCGVLEPFVHVTELDFTGCPGIDDNVVQDVVQAMPALRQLRLGMTRVTDACLQWAGQLTHLSLAHVGNVSDATLERLAASVPGLVYLDIRGCMRVTSRGVAALGALERLHTLRVTKCRRVDNRAFAEGFPKLRELECGETQVVGSVLGL